jgi:plasmid stabilization system protein ParE
LTLPIRTQPQADADILEARVWYDAQRAGLGSAFFEAVSLTVRGVAEMPQAFPRIDGETRRARVRGFQYAVYFEVRDDHILVVAIVHNSRHPDRWRGRG